MVLRPSQMVMPLFVEPGTGIEHPIVSMPGQFRYSIDRLDSIVDRLLDVDVKSVLLFGIPHAKDATGSSSLRPDGIVQQAIAHLTEQYGNQLYVMADVCLCEYTDHGHCGVLANGTVDNDRTLPLLAEQAVSFARAGAHMLAPSAMMDGMVRAIREGLDAAGFTQTPIMSYAAKYASAFYGPFREAAESAPRSGDRNAYQMDPANAREALREVRLDIEEGADVIMVKPALAYLDIVRAVRESTDVPVACYNVSGEYCMIKAAAAAGYMDENRLILESLTSMKRAGADLIITYFAHQAAHLLRQS
jgi:porphobilinogen synthase